MSKPARGTKRVCASCGARFYDLGRSPIICPICETVYQINSPSRRSTAARATAAKPEAVAEAEDTSVIAGAEVISLDEAAEAEKGDVADDEIAALGSEDDDIPDDETDADVFLEDDEEEGADVIDIVKTDREADA